MRDRARVDRWCVLWSLLLAVLLLGPALGHGFVLSYDMVWVPDLALNRDALGLASGLPRAVPSDALVATLDEVVPGMLLQKLVLLGALAAGGVGASRLVPARLPLAARLAVVGVFQWNAFVVERLLIGHWPVLVGYALLPWILLLATRWRESGRLPLALPLLLPLASLSASAGLVSAVALLAGGWGTARRRLLLVLVACANAPWLVAGLAHAARAATDPDGARVFALHDEGSLPGPLAALSLGGIWNSQVVPDSRTGALGWATLLVVLGVAAVGARPWWRATAPRARATLLICWAVGWGSAVLTWLAPAAVGWLGEHVPGAGVIRDGARLLGLCAPLLVVLIGYGVTTLVQRLAMTRAAAAGTLVAAALLPVALLPDAAWGASGRLRPADYPDLWARARTVLAERDPEGDVLVLPLTSFRAPRWNHDRPVFDPLGRYLGRPYVASDVLAVDDTVLDGEDPRVDEVAAALRAETPELRRTALLHAGITAVVIDYAAIEQTGAGAVSRIEGETLLVTTDIHVVALPEPTASVGPADTAGVGTRVAVGAAWAAYLALPGLTLLVVARRRRRRCYAGGSP